MVTVIDKFQDAHTFALRHDGVSKEKALEILGKKQAQLASPVGGQPSIQTAPPSALPSGSASTRITVTNPSGRVHSLRILLADGSVFVDAQAPSCADKRPSVWKRFDLSLAVTRLTVVVDGQRKDVALQAGVKEVVIDVGQGGGAIEQYNELLQWR